MPLDKTSDATVRTWLGPLGRKMVLTERGRLLIRHSGYRRYTLLRSQCTEAEAERLADVYAVTSWGAR